MDKETAAVYRQTHRVVYQSHRQHHQQHGYSENYRAYAPQCGIYPLYDGTFSKHLLYRRHSLETGRKHSHTVGDSVCLLQFDIKFSRIRIRFKTFCEIFAKELAFLLHYVLGTEIDKACHRRRMRQGSLDISRGFRCLGPFHLDYKTDISPHLSGKRMPGYCSHSADSEQEQHQCHAYHRSEARAECRYASRTFVRHWKRGLKRDSPRMDTPRLKSRKFNKFPINHKAFHRIFAKSTLRPVALLVLARARAVCGVFLLILLLRT